MADRGHPLISLARDAIRVFLLEQRVVPPPEGLMTDIPATGRPAGAFVSLKRRGELRGCIGTTEPSRPTLAAEVINNAIAAATRDPRFPAVHTDEVDDLTISVDVLGPILAIKDASELDHCRYGVIVRAGSKHGVLLPAIEGINSVAEQLALAREKAGLKPEEDAELFCFEVTRYRET